MEVAWTAAKMIINRRLRMEISLQNVLHTFQEGLGMETASLEAKLLQKLTTMREDILYTSISRPAQDERGLGQGQMTGNYRGIRSGTAGIPPTMYILGPYYYGGLRGRILWSRI